VRVERKLSAVRFLIDGGDEAAARLLLSSEIEAEDHGVDFHGTHYAAAIAYCRDRAVRADWAAATGSGVLVRP
jgi:hypothetical protein